MFKSESAAFQGCHSLTASEYLVKDRLIQLPWPMGVGIRERRANRGPSYREVDELAKGGGQVTADLAE